MTLIRLVRLPFIVMVFVGAFLSGCQGDPVAPRTFSASDEITIVPAFDFEPLTFVGWSTSHQVLICAPVGSAPEFETRVDNPGIASVTDDRDLYRISHPCSDGRVAWIASATFLGNSLGVTKATMFLKKNPSVKSSFNVTVVYSDEYNGKGD